MYQKLQQIEKTYLNLRKRMMTPEVASDIDMSRKLAKQMSDIQEVYDLFQKYKVVIQRHDEAQDILENESDADIVDMAKDQLHKAQEDKQVYEERIKIALLPKDPNDEKDIFLEVRPAAGGDEAGLFASELLRAYLLYAQKQSRKTEMIEEELSGIGAIKIAVVKISGDRVYSKLKWESGVHRVQRVPQTETQGRVHTSTVTVAVMPEADDVELDFDPNEVELDTFAASSAGGQNANKNQTGVRLRHQPSGIIVTIADSKSQLKNKEKAFSILKAKLYQLEQEKLDQQDREARSDQIGSGARSEKIRTYNFPQDRVTDHRIKQSWSNLPSIMSGELDDIVHKINIANQAKQLAQQLQHKQSDTE